MIQFAVTRAVDLSHATRADGTGESRTTRCMEPTTTLIASRVEPARASSYVQGESIKRCAQQLVVGERVQLGRKAGDAVSRKSN